MDWFSLLNLAVPMAIVLIIPTKHDTRVYISYVTLVVGRVFIWQSVSLSMFALPMLRVVGPSLKYSVHMVRRRYP